METIGIATSAMLVELNVSCWTARKLDKQVSEEVDAVKKTRARGGNYHKNLLAGVSVCCYAFHKKANYGLLDKLGKVIKEATK